MKVQHRTLVVVVDGTKINLFENVDSQGGVRLHPLPTPQLVKTSGVAGGEHHDSPVNPAHGQDGEDDFAASVAAYLNKAVVSREMGLILIAAPKTLGELRKQLDKAAAAAVVGELAKDLTGQPARQVEEALRSVG